MFNLVGASFELTSLNLHIILLLVFRTSGTWSEQSTYDHFKPEPDSNLERVKLLLRNHKKYSQYNISTPISNKKDFTIETNPVPETRISGGAPVRYGQASYQVYIYNWLEHNFCGGTLVEVNELRFVVSAAHCFWLGDVNSTTSLDTEFITVFGGTINVHGSEPRLQLFNVSRIVIHEWYDPRFKLNDIALVFLNRWAPRFDGLDPMNLPDPDFDLPDYVQISGFGSPKFGGHTDGLLKIIDLPILDFDECKPLYPWLTSNAFCAGNYDKEFARGPCQGDSGGPAVGYNWTLHKWYLYGVVSSNIGPICGSFASHFIRVSKHYDWIRGFALTHIIYCGTGHPTRDPPSKYRNCKWPYDDPCYSDQNCPTDNGV